MPTSKTGINPETGQWMRYWLPYHFRAMAMDGKRHVYLPLNRQYKPIGIVRSFPYVNYEDYLPQAVQFARDPRTFKDVWVNDPNGGLFLYSDNYASQLDYFKRLDRLCQHKMKLVGGAK